MAVILFGFLLIAKTVLSHFMSRRTISGLSQGSSERLNSRQWVRSSLPHCLRSRCPVIEYFVTSQQNYLPNRFCYPISLCFSFWRTKSCSARKSNVSSRSSWLERLQALNFPRKRLISSLCWSGSTLNRSLVASPKQLTIGNRTD